MSSSRWATLENRDFRLLLFTRLMSWLGLQVQAVIVGWQIYQLRPDPLLLGMIGLAEAIPAISSSFVSGHLVDIHRPVTILRMSLVLNSLNGILLIAGVFPGFNFPTDLRIALLFSAVFISGAARAFTGPAVFSLTPQVVERAQISSAAAWHSSTYQVASIAGPALGGLAYALLGAFGSFLLPLFFQTTALLLTFQISARTRQLKSSGHRDPFFKSITSGLQFVFKNKPLLSAISLDMFSVLFGGAVAILPIYADQILHVGSTGLGLLRAAPSIGSIVIAVAFAVKPMRVISGRALLWAVAGFGLSTVLFAISTNFVLSLIFLACSGAFDGVSMVIRGTILQLLTPDHMRGRVSSVSSVFITSSNEIGAFESGFAAKFMGTAPSVVFGGIMTLFIVAITAWASPEFRRMRLEESK